VKDALILILLDVCNVSRILVEDLCYLTVTVRYWLANYLINLLSAFLDFAITAHAHTRTHSWRIFSRWMWVSSLSRVDFLPLFVWKENLWKNGWGFYWPCSQQCQRTEGNSKHWSQPGKVVHWPHPSSIQQRLLGEEAVKFPLQWLCTTLQSLH